MKFLLLCFLVVSLQAKYLDSKSCQECHEKIYSEHMTSMHAKSSLFSDQVHARVKNAVDENKYSCALCHMPSTLNLASMIRGFEQPNPSDVRQTDGVSCIYCHQIRDIYHSKQYNINFSNAVAGEKPIMYGNLVKPDDSDKHATSPNEIYKNSEVCMGCHSHKQNDKGFEVCNTKNEYDKTSDCIGCHMPKAPGGNEKFNKKGRHEYVTHQFLGIHSEEMVQKAVKLELSYEGNSIELSITNKMGHAIITHPMRLKYAKTTLSRDGKVIWSNFNETPLEDKEATFIIVFEDDKGAAAMPHDAIAYKINQNLKAMSTKKIKYNMKNLQKGDEITTEWISYPVNPKIAKKLNVMLEKATKPYSGSKISIVVQ